MNRNDSLSNKSRNHHDPALETPRRASNEKSGPDDASSFESILNRARDLDKDALGLLYERYLAAVYRFIYLRVGDTNLAEDLTSDVFFRLVAHIQQLHASDELTFAAWILRIARNAVLGHYRKARTHPPTESVSQLTLTASAEEGDPLTVIMAREDWAEVVSALNTLTEDQRNVVLYRCLLGYTTEEVAQLLEKRPGAIRALQFRALTSLVRLLDKSTVPGERAGRTPELLLERRRAHGTR